MNKRKIFVGVMAALLLSGCASGGQSGESGAGQSVPEGVIGAKEAEKAALDHAGLSAEEVVLTKSEYDRGDNDYDIEFTAGDYKYEYDIGAADGGVLEFSKEKIAVSPADGASGTAPDSSRVSPPETEKPPAEPDKTSAAQPAPSTPAASPSGAITAEEAKSAALAHAGLSASEVTFTKTEYELDNGRGEYDIEFVTGSHEYEYEISVDGTVLESSKKALDKPAAAAPSGAITAEEAKSAALAHAGLSASEVTFTKTEYELDNGRGEYDIEFVTGSHEYEYEIAADGTVLESSKKALVKPAAASPSGAITAEEAKSAALAHAGLSASEVTFTKTEYELDDGRGEYEIEFIAGGVEYEYKLDAATGDIIGFETE